ncbi:actin-like protein 7A [Struthio camelus]|uniref:actin-like protein 7A n=1 Tax=Struthio camelus TaxID=8801 RepID=UPI00051E5141|nr:PREDICTED: actin-like protein 7A [Struthio camelus australis]
MVRGMSIASCKAITTVRGKPVRKAAPATTPSKPKGDSQASVAKGHLKAVKETRAIVIDLGTGYSKFGFAGDPWPSHVISSTVGKQIQETAKTGNKRKETFVGRELQTTSVPLELINPLRHGIVVDWNCVQDTWEYIFHTAMKIQPEDHAVLVSDPPLSPTTNREKYAEMLFEGFCVPAIHIAYQSRLSMYSYGRTSALVVESGHGVSCVVPIYEGYIMPSITGRVEYAGLDITRYLMKLLNESGKRFTEDQLSIIEDLKEKCCYTSLDLEQDLSLPVRKQQIDYELPDGHLITIGKERFLCAEALFNPALLCSQEPGLSQLTVTYFKKCDSDLKRRLVGNILLCGGSTMMAGFADRFQSELIWLCPNDHLSIAASPQRKSSVWIGGSILASLQSFQQLWVYRREYEEHGPACIFKKCF